MSLLIKEIVEDVQYISEDILDEEGNTKGKNYFIEGIIMQGDIQNRNGRVYPKETLIREMNRYNKNYVEAKRAYGELGHPAGPTINLDRVSHMFTELKEDGSNVIGRAKIMETPMGKIVKSLIDEGANLGISSRGMGSIKKNKQGIMEVQNDFMLATAGDIVADPSAPDAFVKGVMEGVDWVYDVASSTWTTANAFDRIEEEIKEIAKVDPRKLEEQAAVIFEKFIKSLSKT
jgi:ABC-type branched-subunit amino acid transport system substrate-binding protein